MTTRRDKFEKERKKMLSQMGMDDEVISTSCSYDPTPEEMAENEKGYRIIRDMVESFPERKKQVLQEAANERAAAIACVGPVESFLFNWSIGGAYAVFGLFFVLCCIPFGVFMSDGNLGQGLIYGGFFSFIIFVIIALMGDMIVPFALQLFLRLGPKYTVHMREFHPIGSIVFAPMNFVHIVLGRGFILWSIIIGFVSTPYWSVFGLYNWFSIGTDSYWPFWFAGCVQVLIVGFFLGAAHWFMCGIYEAVSDAFVNALSKGEYQLRYLFDGVPMFDYRPIKEGLPTIDERKEFFNQRFGIRVL